MAADCGMPRVRQDAWRLVDNRTLGDPKLLPIAIDPRDDTIRQHKHRIRVAEIHLRDHRQTREALSFFTT
jgi:hypothetical protein